MAQRPVFLDMLTGMAEEWHDTTTAMLTITIGMVMLKLEQTTVTVRLDNVADIMNRYEIIRTYGADAEGVPFMTVTLKERENAEVDGSRQK